MSNFGIYFYLYEFKNVGSVSRLQKYIFTLFWCTLYFIWLKGIFATYMFGLRDFGIESRR